MRRLVQSPYKVLIPLVVLDEVTGLTKSANKGEKASLALDVLNKFIADKDVSLLTSKVTYDKIAHDCRGLITALVYVK